MSRIGKMPIKIPEKVKVTLKDGLCHVEGPLGKATIRIDDLIEVVVADGSILVKRKGDSPKEESALARCRHGLMRNLIRNAVEGSAQGFKKELDINGVGFRAEVKGSVLHMALGFSHPVEFPIPKDIKIAVEKQTHLAISGLSRQLVGETAARIRKFRPPEPYKGKGIKYTSEVIRRKVGKSAVASGGGK